MKIIPLLLPLSLFFFFSCHSGKPGHDADTAGNKESRPVLIDSWYNYAATTDRTYCSQDSIVPSDCSGGTLRFTPKGNVISTFFCMGNDSTSFSIGTYTVDATGISCSFTERYSYYSGCFDCDDAETAPQDPNSGKLYRISPYSIRLEKTACKDFPYGYHDREEDMYYAVSEMDSPGMKNESGLYSKIDALRDR